MRKIFQHIRRQPKSVRDNYALGIAGSFTSIVVLLWVVAFPSEGLLDAPDEVAVEKTTPFATLISESKKRFVALKTSLQSASSSDSRAAVVTSTTTSSDIVLSEADIALALQKASSTQSGTSTTPQTDDYTEVLIGTTTQSGISSTTATSSASVAPVTQGE